MAYYLRTIRKARWYGYPGVNWVGKGHVPSDALLDLQTKDNALSVYRIDNDADIDRVVVAVAANRSEINHVDYAVFDGSSLLNMGAVFVQADGDTPDHEVNQLHHDTTHLTVFGLTSMAREIFRGHMNRFLRNKIKQLMGEAIRDCRLDKSKISKKILQDLGL